MLIHIKHKLWASIIKTIEQKTGLIAIANSQSSALISITAQEEMQAVLLLIAISVNSQFGFITVKIFGSLDVKLNVRVWGGLCMCFLTSGKHIQQSNASNLHGVRVNRNR